MKLNYRVLTIFPFLFWMNSSNGQIDFSQADGDDFGVVLKYSHNGSVLLSGSKNNLGHWVPNTNLLSKSNAVRGAKDINDLAFLDNDTVFISGGDDDILMYDLKNSGIITKLKGHNKKVTSISFDPASRRLFSSSMDKTAILWNIDSGTIIKQFKDHKDFVLATAIDPVSGKLASCGSDGIVNVYSNLGELIFSEKLESGWLWSVDYTYDGKYMAVGGQNNTYILTDLNTATPKIFDINKVNGSCLSVKYSPDGKYIGIGTSDQYVYLFESETQKMLLKKKITEGPVVDLEFDPDGKSMITSHKLSTHIFKWDLRSLNILPSKYVNDLSDKSPPQVFISNPSHITDDRVIVYTDQIKLQGTVIDESGVYKLLVNSVNTIVSDNGSFTINLRLATAENQVLIEAQDINNNVSLRRLTIIRKDALASAYDPGVAKNYLLVIGINKYQNFAILQNAINDANAVAGTLTGLYNFDFSDVTLLLDSMATRNNIYNTLRSYVEKVGPKDNFLVYFSGHGYFDDVLNEGYWIPVDADKTVGTFFSNSDVLKIIKNINSQHTLLIADACFAGSLFNETSKGLILSKKSEESSSRKFIENVEKFRSRWGLASGRLEEVSDGSVGKNSPFAKNLLDFLRNTPHNSIAISEIVQYVKMKVPNGARQTPIGNPLKNAGDEGGEFIFYKRK